MNKQILKFLLTAILLSVAGCGSPTPEHTFELGHYTGRNPDVSFDLVDNSDEFFDGGIEITNFLLATQLIEVDGVFYPSQLGDSFLSEARASVSPDGTFSYEGWGVICTGKIAGDVASGNFSYYESFVDLRINGILIEKIQLDEPVKVDLNWTATLGGTLPTATPFPFPTAIPPKLGHYEGMEVSFDVTTSGVENFNSDIGVTDDSGCRVWTESTFKINENGLFTVKDMKDTKDIGLFGVINGDTVVGNYEFRDQCAVACPRGNVCSYVPGISRGGVWNAQWVSPHQLEANQLKVTYYPSPAKFQSGGVSGGAYTCAYKTSVKAIGVGVRIKKFGMYFWENNQWVHSTSNDGQPWSSQDFADWYSCPGAYIDSGQECSDPNNWSGADTPILSKGKWYYVGVDDNGNEVQGEAVIECQP